MEVLAVALGLHLGELGDGVVVDFIEDALEFVDFILEALGLGLEPDLTVGGGVGLGLGLEKVIRIFSCLHFIKI